MRVIVMHAAYGCETGCTGHVVVLDPDGPEEQRQFEFEHPASDESPREFAERLVRETFGEEHVADLDWDNCLVVD